MFAGGHERMYPSDEGAKALYEAVSTCDPEEVRAVLDEFRGLDVKSKSFLRDFVMPR